MSTTVTPSLCAKRCASTIAHGAVDENNTYAVLFDGSGNSASFGTRLPDDLFANCQSNGGDICFSSDVAGATQLACEIAYISTSAKKAEIWVPVALSTSTDVTIYIWYQSKSGTLAQPATSGTYGAQAVWNAAGIAGAVWHLGDTPTGTAGDFKDSTANANNSTNATNEPTSASGHFAGNAASFAGANSQRLIIANSASLSPPANAMAISMWVNQGTQTVDFAILCDKAYNESYTFSQRAHSTYPGEVGFGIGKSGSDVQANQDGTYVHNYEGAWHHVYGVADGTFVYLYVDGALIVKVSQTISIGTTTQALGIGTTSSGTQPYNGAIDELRIGWNSRSANYIATDYAIQSSTSLVIVGTPGVVGMLPPPLFQGAA